MCATPPLRSERLGSGSSRAAPRCKSNCGRGRVGRDLDTVSPPKDGAFRERRGRGSRSGRVHPWKGRVYPFRITFRTKLFARWAMALAETMPNAMLLVAKYNPYPIPTPAPTARSAATASCLIDGFQLGCWSIALMLSGWEWRRPWCWFGTPQPFPLPMLWESPIGGKPMESGKMVHGRGGPAKVGQSPSNHPRRPRVGNVDAAQSSSASAKTSSCAGKSLSISSVRWQAGCRRRSSGAAVVRSGRFVREVNSSKCLPFAVNPSLRRSLARRLHLKPSNESCATKRAVHEFC